MLNTTALMSGGKTAMGSLLYGLFLAGGLCRTSYMHCCLLLLDNEYVCILYIGGPCRTVRSRQWSV